MISADENYYLLISLYLALIFGILIFAPAFVVGLNQLKYLYLEWFKLMQWDESVTYGMSVMGFISQIFGRNDVVKHLVVFLGISISVISVIYHNYKLKITDTSTLLNIFSILSVALIIFNPRAESQTYAFAYLSIVVWFFNLRNIAKADYFVFVIVIIFGVLAPTDIYPRYIRDNYWVPYSMQAMACFIVWLRLIYNLLSRKLAH